MKKNVLKKLLILAIVCVAIFGLYHLYHVLFSGKQSLKTTIGRTYYAGNNIEGVIEVRNRKKNELIKSKLKVELRDENNKKVENAKATYKIEEGEVANISLETPENMASGNYYLHITSSSNLLKDKVKVPIVIQEGKEVNTSIFLDKGIYKPGDEINYRVLLTSKKNDTPVKEEVAILIYDGNDNKVYEEKLETSDFGIVSGKFNIASEVNSGEYELVVERKSGNTSKIFKVNPYITPKFESTISTSKDSYLVGEDIEYIVSAKYFFGEPVKNATVKGMVGETEINGITDENGIFTFSQKAEEVGSVNAQLEIIDTSNYSVEATKNVFIGTDIFEIEVLPEFGEIVKGIDNEVYIITKNIDGTPVKTYAHVSFGNITRQVVTDENGVGKVVFSESDLDEFNVSSSDYSYSYQNKNNNTNVNNQYEFKVSAENMNGEKVEISEYLDIKNLTNTLITTDKEKYNAGDDIKISLVSNSDTETQQIAIYKNKELLKLVSTENEEVTVNLEDTYGIIDIYTFNNSYDNYYYYNYYQGSYESVKTIYIKPDKELNISIQTDSEEYEPGDNLELNFETKDENNKLVDSALLVSILDEAILNLESNDLSIDNIKLALSDIVLTSDLTAADVYAAAIDDKSETLLKSILLRQSRNNNQVSTQTYRNYVDDNWTWLILSVIILAILILIKVMIKVNNKEKILKILRKIVNFVAIYIALLFSIGMMLFEIFYSSEWIIYIANLMLTIAVYILWLNKYDEFIFRMIIDLVLVPFVAMILVELVDEFILLIAMIPPFVWCILYVLNQGKKKKWKTNLINIMKEITKSELIAFVTILLGTIISNFVLYDILYVTSGTEVLIAMIFFIAIYCLFKKLFTLKLGEVNLEKIVKFEISERTIIGLIIALVVVIFIVYVESSNQRNQICDSYDGPITNVPNYSKDSDMLQYDPAMNAVEAAPSNSISSITDNFGDLFDFGISNSIDSSMQSSDVKFEENNMNIENEIEQNNTQTEEIKNAETEENVRNVFLESLAFIPELVTENGKANTNLKISDNITTWSIQTVGNTKNGNIGYASSNIKVFKEFFVDFSLPTNSVVTDQTSIPVTVYNYTENALTVSLNVKENDWSTIGEYTKEVQVPAKNTTLVYIPLEILKHGQNTLRVEATANGVSDIVERTMEVTPNGLEISNVVSSGSMEKTMEQDIIFNDENMISDTEELILKLYPSAMAQVVNGMENILRMPTGCFEQTSSALYPNILVLQYLENNNLTDDAIKEKAINYISSGYQRLLTFEVPGENGGYSLYGNSPAETVLTAFGLMELTELSKVYTVDENVLEDMKNFIYEKQNINGTFDYSSTYIGSPSSTDKLAMNAYITWALSEAFPDDIRITKSVEYLEENFDKVEDNYTLALMANVFINTNSKEKDKAIQKLSDKVIENGDIAYVSSKIRDYYGSYGRMQDIQTTALTSIAFTKSEEYSKTNKLLINYLISVKDKRGTWSSTQSTVLALQALVKYSENSDISNQDIKVSLNGKEQVISIKDNALDIYEVRFDNVEKENKLSIEMKKGKITYEIVQNYYTDYAKLDLEDKKDFLIQQEINTNVKVNEKITQKLWIANLNDDVVTNGLIQISIPQGCTVDEESLLRLKYNGIIEKYEYSYGKINLYIRNFSVEKALSFEVVYKALYPEKITGGAIRVFDYYNPDVETILKPQEFLVTE